MLTIDQAIEMAYQRRASDIHITAGLPVMMRVNGALLMADADMLTPELTKKTIEPMLTDHHKATLKQFGEVDFSYSLKSVGRCRVNVYLQRSAFACAIRLISDVIPKPEQLGLNDSVVDLANRKRGLVLVTGPTGSGKSTTLASIIDVINKKHKEHIITLEDPIEYLHKHNKSMVNQREIGHDSKSFAGALRAALRQDPDVILVGEMRDNETIATAITAAETGHLVFSTLHTIGAAATIDRVIDVFPPHQQQQIRIQLASVLECVISQQLMPNAEGTGRVAAFEVMHANSGIKNLIREQKVHMIPSIIQTNKRNGMCTMDDSLYELYSARRISGTTAISFAQDPAAMEKKVLV